MPILKNMLFLNHQVIDEDKFDKLLSKEKDQLNPIFILELEIKIISRKD